MITAYSMQGLMTRPAGTLDDTSWVKPTTQIDCDDAQARVCHQGDLHAFTRTPA